MTSALADLTLEHFDGAVSSGLWLVDFWASWCGPCRALEPVLDQVAIDRPEVRIGRVEILEQPELAARFDVRSVPTLIVLRDGEPVRSLFGSKTHRQILRAIEEATAGPTA